MLCLNKLLYYCKTQRDGSYQNYRTNLCLRRHKRSSYYYYYYYYYYSYSALGPVRAETRAQSGHWYGSGILHPGQVLRGSLPLLSPAFFLDVPTFHHQVPPRPPRRERSQRRKWEPWTRMLSGNFAEMTTSTPFRNLLHAANL